MSGKRKRRPPGPSSASGFDSDLESVTDFGDVDAMYTKLSVPIVCHSVSSGIMRHIREDGVVTYGWGKGRTFRLRNPTNITYCGERWMEDMDVDDEQAVNEGSWCKECRNALVEFLAKREAALILTTQQGILF